MPLFVMGRGSNLLVRDGGIRGVVVHLARGEFKQSRGARRPDHGRRRREADANSPIAARDAQIGGFEWFEGIPGNVGGALRMNAGAMGGETFRQVVSVRFVDPHGEFPHAARPARWTCTTGTCGTLDEELRGLGDVRRPAEHAGGNRGSCSMQSTQKRTTIAAAANRAPAASSRTPSPMPGGQTRRRTRPQRHARRRREGLGDPREFHRERRRRAPRTTCLSLIEQIKDKALQRARARAGNRSADRRRRERAP